MTKQEFINWAKQRGWKKDPYGNLRKEKTDPVSHHIKVYRFKLNKYSARYEVQDVGNGELRQSRWIRLRTGFYKNLSIDSKNRVVGFRL